MKAAPLLLGTALAALLGACAPTLSAPHTGRIVNTGTGQEGTVQFLAGSLTPQSTLSGPDNVVITIGNDTYTGRTVLLEGAALATQPYGFNFSFGATTGSAGSGAGVNVGYGPQPRTAQTLPTLKTGNLIARTATTPTKTLTCILTVDGQGRGIGDCTDQTGVKYAMQF